MNIDVDLLKKCVNGIYTINDDGSIDVNGDVNLSDKKLTRISFNFRNVSGHFDCYDNQLTSLEGSPNTVGGRFHCSSNQLQSLEGSPTTVGGGVYCYDNKLQSLEGAPAKVGGSFNCLNNPNLPYSELFKIVDNVEGSIYYLSLINIEDKYQIRRDRDIKETLKDDELGNLDV